MRETALVRKIIKALRERGVYAVKVHQGGYGMVGVPDVLACVSGTFVALEVKVGSRQATQAQSWHIDAVRSSNGVAAVVRSEDEALAACGLAIPLRLRSTENKGTKYQ